MKKVKPLTMRALRLSDAVYSTFTSSPSEMYRGVIYQALEKPKMLLPNLVL